MQIANIFSSADDGELLCKSKRPDSQHKQIKQKYTAMLGCVTRACKTRALPRDVRGISDTIGRFGPFTLKCGCSVFYTEEACVI